MKEIVIAAICKGTVIDHIPSQHTFRVVDLLGISKTSDSIVVANNLPSKKHGLKGLVKIKDKYLQNKDIHRIALFAPNATISKIADYKVIEKSSLKRPKEYIDIIKCFNPGCITNNEAMLSRFTIIAQKPLLLKCWYCERELKKEDIRLL